MTIRNRPYYWVECNCCGELAYDDDEGCAIWEDSGVAIEHMGDADFVTVEVAGSEQQLCSACWSWPEDMPGYDEATNLSDDPVRAHDKHPIEATELFDDAMMRGLGFTDRRPDNWYACYPLMAGDTTLNLTVNKESGGWTENVLNEHFGQPEYYGYMKPEFRDKIVGQIDEIIDELQRHGLPFEVDHGDYGYRGESDE